VALVVDWTATLALALLAALAGSAPGGLLERVRSPLRDVAYVLGSIGVAGALPG
jgi:hypothetical protein